MSDTLSPAFLFALGLFAALWLLAGLWATLRGIAMQRRSAFVAGQAERLASLVEASPQLPVIVRAEWRIEASERLGRWLGLEDRKSVVLGKSVSVRVSLGGRRTFRKKTKHSHVTR